MDGFSYRNRQLYCEDLPVASLAKRYGTPLYVYSRAAILARYDEIKSAFAPADPLICYSVKANSNQSVLRLLVRRGAGFDVVSGGELYRVLKAGGRASKIVFAGVGKTAEELKAGVTVGIHAFDVESVQELESLNRVAALVGKKASALLRLNPDVDARTHGKTTTAKKENKFGIDLHRAREILSRCRKYCHVEIRGIHLHLGSPIYTVGPYRDALRKVAQFIREVRDLGATMDTLNIGGGYGISYDGNTIISPSAYAKTILSGVAKFGTKLILEPGRYIVGNAGILLSQVTYVKQGWLDRRFVVLDAAMNDLLRPALYDSYHHIWPVKGSGTPLVTGRKNKPPRRLETVDIVGPICETSDCFGRDRKLPPLKEGDLVSIFSAGAYGMSMASTYNSRPRPGEVLVTGYRSRLIRKRETYDDLIRGE